MGRRSKEQPSTALAKVDQAKVSPRERTEEDRKLQREYCEHIVLDELETAHRIVYDEILCGKGDDAQMPYSELSARSRVAIELAKLDIAAARTAKQAPPVVNIGVIIPPIERNEGAWEASYADLDRKQDERQRARVVIDGTVAR